MTQKVETVEIKHETLGKIIIGKSDYDPKKHEMWAEIEEPEGSAALTEAAFRELSYSDQKSFAGLYGITGNGENALVEKLKEKGIL